MYDLNFRDTVFFRNAQLIDRTKSKVLISFDTHLYQGDVEYMSGETFFIFDLFENTVMHTLYRNVTPKKDSPFVDPYFSSILYNFLSSQGFDFRYEHPLASFLTTQSKHIKILKLLKCFPN